MTDISKLFLTEPSVEVWRDYRALCREMRLYKVEDFAYPRLDSLRQFNEYSLRCRLNKAGKHLKPGFVPDTAFWLTDGCGGALGGGSLRHFLNDGLREFGGHIGYYVRPSLWRKGVGTRLLALLLDEARELEISIARVTCFEGNAASAGVIEKNGGYLIEKRINVIKGNPRLTRIYEILL